MMDKDMFVYFLEATCNQVYRNIGIIVPTYLFIILEVTYNQVTPTLAILTLSLTFIRVLGNQGLNLLES